MKIEGSGSGSISQRHGSSDPDPHQNVMDPQHWNPPVRDLCIRQHDNPIPESTLSPHSESMKSATEIFPLSLLNGALVMANESRGNFLLPDQ